MKITVLILSLILILNAQTLEKVKLQLKWKNQFQFAGFIAAKEKGFYKDEGIEVELLEYMASTDTLLDLQEGKTTFALSDSSVILEAGKGKKLVALMAVYQDSPYVIMSLKSSNITTLSDMNNKKLALYDDMNGDAIAAMLKMNNINVHKTSITNQLAQLQNGEVDLAIGYSSNEPYKAIEMGMELNIFDLNDNGFHRYGDILFTLEDTVKNRPGLVAKMYRASKKGFKYAYSNIDEMVDIIYDKYNTQKKSKEAYYYEANVLKKLLGNGSEFGKLNSAKVASIGYFYAYNNSQNYSLENLDNFIYNPSNNLTLQEKEWLNDNHIVKIRVGNYPPYQMTTNGKPEGISVDYIKKIFKKYNIKYKFVSSDTMSWSDSLEFIRDKKLDLLMSAKNTPQRQKYMLFTDNYISSPWVIYTRNDSKFISNINGLEGKTVSIEEGFVMQKLLQTRYPQIKLKIMKGIFPTQNAMKALAVGEVDAYIGNLTIGSYLLKSLSLDNIQVAAPTPFGNHENAMAVRDDWSPLISIINRELKAMSSQEKNLIYNKYLSIHYDYGISFWDVVKWIAIVTFVLGAIVIAISITNRKLAREIKKRKLIEEEKSILFDKLQQMANGYAEFIDELPIGMVSSDPMDQKESHYNKTFFQMFGWDIEEIDTLDKWFNKAYPDAEYRVEVIREWGEKVEEAKRENKSSSTPMEVKVTCKDGSIKWCQARYYEKMKFINAGIFVDISERKKVEDELFGLNNSLEEKIEFEISKNKKHQLLMMEQVKLAQMGEMIENIAHQWRQPLAQVNSSVLIMDAVLRRSGFINELVNSKLLEIESLTEYMSNTIDDFQNFFNPDKEERQFNLREVIDKSISIIHGSLVSNFTKVELNIDKIFSAKGYPLELQQVIVIILSNANDALRVGEVKNPKIIIDVEDFGDIYEISISDNGGGVKTDNIEQVFEPYYTTKHKSQGRGVGLYMAKMIIEEGMKGKLTLENKNSGACFKIEFLKGSKW